jgi:hypothetical protein
VPGVVPLVSDARHARMRDHFDNLAGAAHPRAAHWPAGDATRTGPRTGRLARQLLNRVPASQTKARLELCEESRHWPLEFMRAACGELLLQSGSFDSQRSTVLGSPVIQLKLAFEQLPDARAIPIQKNSVVVSARTKAFSSLEWMVTR